MKYLILLTLGILSLAMIFFLQGGFIFILFGMMPSMVAYFIDRLPGRNIFKCVFVCNFSGMIPTFAEVAKADSIGATLQTLMGDPLLWAIVYFSAAGGYIILWVCRTITRMSVTIKSEKKIESLKKSQEELVDEWGPLIKRKYG